MVINLAGLQSIPAELYEAARIDGATGWQSFWRITLPLLQPVTAINVTLATLGAFNVFDLVYVITQGGPAQATNVATLDIYTQAFQFLDCCDLDLRVVHLAGGQRKSLAHLMLLDGRAAIIAILSLR